MNKERKNLLVFGYGLAVILIVWSALYARKHPHAHWLWVLIALAAVLAAMTRWRLEYLKPIYRNWMRVAHLIGTVISTGLLTVIFYLVFTPTAIILRVLGKDLLDRSPDPQAGSYWKARQPVDDRQRYTKQF